MKTEITHEEFNGIRDNYKKDLKYSVMPGSWADGRGACGEYREKNTNVVVLSKEESGFHWPYTTRYYSHI